MFKDLLGLWSIVTATVFGCVCLFELDLKTKVKIGICYEIFFSLLVLGLYLLNMKG